MRYLLLLLALAMPVAAWFSQQGAFGPDNATISDRYPTLLVAAGYAFAVWGLIFALDVAFAAWQALRERGATVDRVRVPVAIGFALTALWMPVFSQEMFWLALLVIWASLAALLHATIVLSRDETPGRGMRLFAWLPISLHAGWLSLAAFLDTAQVVVAYELGSRTQMLSWSLVLFAGAAALLLWANARMRGNVPYALVALWGLAAVWVKQSGAALAGAEVAAWVALGIGGLLALQTGWLLRTRRA